MYRTSRDSVYGRAKPADPVTKDVAFNRKSFGLNDHVSPFDNATVQIGTDGIEVMLLQGIDEESFARVLWAAERETKGLDVREALDHVKNMKPDEASEMFKGGLQSALETQTIVFVAKGLSRTATHQIVRSRRAGFHQQSQRASYMGDYPEVRMPESIWRAGRSVVSAWLEAYRACSAAYRIAADANVSYQDCRFILPEGTCNSIMMEYTVREFLNVYAYRGCSMFQWEIVRLMRMCREALIEKHPWIEPYVKISCEVTKGALDYYNGVQPGAAETEATAHHCTFQGWEEVEHQCDFPWARESNRSFRSTKHVIKKAD